MGFFFPDKPAEPMLQPPKHLTSEVRHLTPLELAQQFDNTVLHPMTEAPAEALRRRDQMVQPQVPKPPYSDHG